METSSLAVNDGFSYALNLLLGHTVGPPRMTARFNHDLARDKLRAAQVHEIGTLDIRTNTVCQ